MSAEICGISRMFQASEDQQRGLSRKTDEILLDMVARGKNVVSHYISVQLPRARVDWREKNGVRSKISAICTSCATGVRRLLCSFPRSTYSQLRALYSTSNPLDALWRTFKKIGPNVKPFHTKSHFVTCGQSVGSQFSK
jgi:hypothetical protein